ncbi:MAG: DUF6232 family protein [Methylophilus sp.]|uniref:DUF6232 family protein n=1 Tax=Methylophilus sp. TaxID=29541 RepID=UPI0040350950
MNKDVYFCQNGVSVSSSHLTVNGKTYPLKSIIFSRVAASNTWRGLSIISILLGLLLMADEGPLFVVGGVLFFAGVLTWINSNAAYSLLITWSDGESPVLVTNDKLFMEKVIGALDAAMTDKKWNSENVNLTHETFTPSSNNHNHLSF